MKTNMKTGMILMLSMMLITVGAFARKPPVSVQNTFKDKFPHATHVTWIIEEPTIWEAFFTINGIKSSADFSIDGTWLETETEVKLAELPKVAKDKLMMESTDWTVEEVYKVETCDNALLYSIDLKKGAFKKVVAFHPDGSLVNLIPQS